MARKRQSTSSTYVHRFRVLQIAGVIVMGLVFWFALNISSVNEFFAARRGRNFERFRVERLRREVAQLQVQATALKRGTFEKEKAIREQFQLVRPGENLIQIVDEESETTGSTRSRLREKR